MTGKKTTTLGEAAYINPRLTERLDDDASIAFVPMAAVSSEEAQVIAPTARPYSEVKKGYTYFESGDVLVAKITPCFENGKIAQANLPHKVGFGSTEFHVVRPRHGVSDGRYLHHYLRQPHVRSAGERRMTGSGGQRRVPEDYLASLPVPLPTVPEQRRIATILDQADALRAQRRQALAELDKLVRAVFFEMFGTLEAPKSEASVTALEDIVEPGRIVTYGIVQAGPHVHDGVPYIRTGDIKDGRILVDQLARTSAAIAKDYSRSALNAGDIVMSIRATVGTTAVVPESLAGANLTQGTARISPGPGVDGVYLLQFLRTKSAQDWIQSQVKGATFREITLGRLRQLPVLLPNLNRQREFAKRIQAIESVVANHRAALLESDVLFASLQHRAFTGAL